jgi:hypothetical protein
MAIIALLLALFAPALMILQRASPCTASGGPALGCFAAVAAVVFGQMAVAEAIPRDGPWSTWRIVARVAQALGALTLALCIFAFVLTRHSGIERGPGESGPIGHFSLIMSAEAAYMGSNGGYYDNLECLRAPSTCIPGYAPTAQTFLTDPEERYGRYDWTFHPGPPAPEEAIRGGEISPSSLTSWAVVAVPIKRREGSCRAFCLDSSSRLCATSDGTAPSVADGLCSPSCRTLRWVN